VPSPLYVPNLDGSNVYQNSAAAVDLSYTSYGFVKVRLITPLSKKVKVCIQAGGGTYYYDLKNNGGTETYPLQMGSGNYSVSVYENISGDSYSELLSKSASVSLSSSFDPYLVPSQFINYSSSSSAVSIARGLVSGKSNNYERISAVLTYVATHISYDYALAKSVQSGYVPDIAADLSRGRGICFDYAAVSAAMLRSLGYPTKLMMGYVENGTVYHAWNEVYISGKGWVKVSSVTLNTSNWSRIDVTFISTSTSPETIAKYIGNSSNYKTVYTY
jgi:transglutaminase-like putative cysteine protease